MISLFMTELETVMGKLKRDKYYKYDNMLVMIIAVPIVHLDIDGGNRIRLD